MDLFDVGVLVGEIGDGTQIEKGFKNPSSLALRSIEKGGDNIAWLKMRRRNPDDKHTRCLGILPFPLLPLVERVDEVLRFLGRENEHARVDGVVVRVGLVCEFCDDAKVAASAADAPEEICVFGFIGVDDLAVGEDHLDVNEIVDDHPEIRSCRVGKIPILST